MGLVIACVVPTNVLPWLQQNKVMCSRQDGKPAWPWFLSYVILSSTQLHGEGEAPWQVKGGAEVSLLSTILVSWTNDWVMPLQPRGHCPGLGHFTRAVWIIDILSRWVSFPAEKPGGILVWFIVQRFTDAFGNMVVAGTSQRTSRRSQINSVNTSTVFQFSLILLHCMLFSFPLLLSTDLRKKCFKYSLCPNDATGMPEEASGLLVGQNISREHHCPQITASALIISKEFPLGIIFQSRCMYVNSVCY